ncbi:universal stress protein [Mycobacterium sp. NPDC050551]|uniref:universal stress protein n=1 Tax=Mycobacterium sp. NPDC050551 TaxID=3155407 RepID=UPI003446C68C
MTSSPSGPYIAVGVDDSPSSQPALEWAAREAELRTMPLVLVYTTPPPAGVWPGAGVPPGLMDWLAQTGHDILEDARQTAKELTHGAVPVTTEYAFMSPAAALVDRSRTAAMVVVGSRGRGALARTVLGSVSTALVHRAHCPVGVIHDDAPTKTAAGAPVLLGFDGSPANKTATELAFEEASRRGVDLIAMHAWWSPGAFEFPQTDWEHLRAKVDLHMSDRLAAWQERYPGVTVHRETVPDQPARRLVERSQDAQLLIVGSHGHGGVASVLLGSVSTAVVQAASIPVIVARQS